MVEGGVVFKLVYYHDFSSSLSFFLPLILLLVFGFIFVEWGIKKLYRNFVSGTAFAFQVLGV